MMKMEPNPVPSGRLTRRSALKAGAALGATAVLSGPLGSVAAQNATGGPVAPRAGTWQPWLLSSGSQFRLPAPPDRAATEAEIRELKARASARSAASLDRVAYWDAGASPYRWTEIFINYSNITNPLGGSVAGRAFALMNAAMYDATIAAWDSKYTYNRPRPTEFDSSLTAVVAVPNSPSYPSEHAAAAGAASAVLAYLFPNDAQSFVDMAEEAAQSRVLAGVQYPSDTVAGLDLGRRVAQLAIERARTDNFDHEWDQVMPEGPGFWIGANPGGVAESMWKPWTLSSPSDLRADPPPAYDSEQLAMELEEIRAFTRTPRSTALALYYQFGYHGSPTAGPGLTIQQASQRIFEDHLEANVPWVARAYAMLAIAFTDIYISNQDTKFAYWSMRPNQLDPTLTTVFPTPNFPSYVSNRAAFTAATADVLGYLFPRDADEFARRAAETAESAIWAGIHFRSDLVAGVAGGRAVARRIIDRARSDA
jgi:membrane-associated phospholipid phosphatase